MPLIEENTNAAWFRRGVKNGLPIMTGYFAVALALGITARNIGLTAFQAMLASLTTSASAGEYAAFTLMSAGAGLIEFAVMQLVTNARYLLMSASLSQKLPPNTSLVHRLLVGFGVTDEIFGVAVSVPDKLNPFYNYGMIVVAVPGWALGTYLGVLLGNILPARLVSALSVALYGMFIAVFIPPARKSRVIAGAVGASFVLSFLLNRLAVFDFMSSGIKTILLTVVISAVCAALFPRKEDNDEV
jgi:predicted branched-subunit amino acid permease